MTGTAVSGSDAWLFADGKYTLNNPPSGTTFWVGHICQWAGSYWKCGCRDQACTINYWQLQGVVR